MTTPERKKQTTSYYMKLLQAFEKRYPYTTAYACHALRFGTDINLFGKFQRRFDMPSLDREDTALVQAVYKSENASSDFSKGSRFFRKRRAVQRAHWYAKDGVVYLTKAYLIAGKVSEKKGKGILAGAYEQLACKFEEESKRDGFEEEILVRYDDEDRANMMSSVQNFRRMAQSIRGK